MPSVASVFLCVFGEDDGWVLDIEDMPESRTGVAISDVTLIELLATKLVKACQREHRGV